MILLNRLGRENRLFIFIAGFFLTFCSAINAQSHSFGIELQGYPAGIIIGSTLDIEINEQSFFSGKLAYNFIRRSDFGEHEDERGNGYGITMGYYNYLIPSAEKLIFGIRSDLWITQIDWQDNIDNLSTTGGETDITVLQPTLYLGYKLTNHWTIHVALGQEINISTRGEDVGEGAILLVGINYRL